MILPYFLSLRRSLSHILPNTLSLSLFLSLYEQFSRSLPFILPRSLSLSLSVLYVFISILFNRYTHSPIEYRGKYIDKGFI